MQRKRHNNERHDPHNSNPTAPTAALTPSCPRRAPFSASRPSLARSSCVGRESRAPCRVALLRCARGARGRRGRCVVGLIVALRRLCKRVRAASTRQTSSEIPTRKETHFCIRSSRAKNHSGIVSACFTWSCTTLHSPRSTRSPTPFAMYSSTLATCRSFSSRLTHLCISFCAVSTGFDSRGERSASERVWVDERRKREPSSMTMTWRKEERREVSPRSCGRESEAVMAILRFARSARLRHEGGSVPADDQRCKLHSQRRLGRRLHQRKLVIRGVVDLARHGPDKDDRDVVVALA